LDRFNNAFANLTSGQFQEWELGVEYSMPLGFRRAYAAVRNAQVLIARERAILEEQERQAVHDLSGAFADADRAHALVQVAYNRLAAAQNQYELAYNAFFNLGGKVSLELVLDARIRLAEAETSYHRARIEYAMAIKNVHFEKGSLLEYNGAMLAGNAFCQGAPEMIAHKNGFGGKGPPLDYVMAKPPKEPSGKTAKESSPAPTARVAYQRAATGAAASPPAPKAPRSDAPAPIARQSQARVEPSSKEPSAGRSPAKSAAPSKAPVAGQQQAAPDSGSKEPSAAQVPATTVVSSRSPPEQTSQASFVLPSDGPAAPQSPPPVNAPSELRLVGQSQSAALRASSRLPEVEPQDQTPPDPEAAGTDDQGTHKTVAPSGAESP
ncbi:MAG: TolC family protein, partial [Pirellulales bacterium]